MDTESGLPDFSSWIQLLQWRASVQSERIAFTFLTDGEHEELTLTYGDLSRQACIIAARLQMAQAEGERVLLLFPPGLDYVAAFLGCLYAGAVAVPIYPPDPTRLERSISRFRAVVADAQPAVVLTTSLVMAMTPLLFAQAEELATIQWVSTDTLEGGLATAWREPTVDRSTLAFLQYTSGSTATPKGVMVSHGNLLHNSNHIHHYFGHSPESVGVIWLPPYHDMGLIGGILQPLYGGFHVVLLSPLDFLRKPLRWLQAVSTYKATTSGGPNFAYELCLRKITPDQRQKLDLSSWEVAFNGAEPIRKDTLDRFADTFSAHGFRREAIYPCYGLAEATLIVSGGEKLTPFHANRFGNSALGHNRAIPSSSESKNITLVSCGQTARDQNIVIVDPESRQPCADEHVGEIWVAGPSVTQGYWHQPEATKQVFCAHLAGTMEGPFLRTGDLGFLQEGKLFVTGRLKDMIIIRGRNYYPQDIELTVERCHPSLRVGCNAVFSVDVDGEEQLVVVQEVQRNYEDFGVFQINEAIRLAIAEEHELQTYAIALIKPSTISKTSSGKVQRYDCRARFLEDSLDLISSSTLTAVNEPRQESFVSKALAAIDDPAARHALLIVHLQEELARLVHVSVGQLDPGKSIGAFGLDSVMAIELAHKIEQDIGVNLSLASLLRRPSLSELAAQVLEKMASPPASVLPILKTHESVCEAPLSHGQQALWFLYQLAPEDAAYNVPCVVRIHSAIDEDALEIALQKLVDAHESLRTTFVISPDSGDVIQRIHERMQLKLAVVDATTWPEKVLHATLTHEANTPFDLENGPLLRVSLYKQAEGKGVLLVVMHHIITDFWSLATLVEQFSTLYMAESQGQPGEISFATYQYTDYVRWQNELLAAEQGQRQWQYWQEQLSGDLPVLDLPTDFPRPPVQTYSGNIYTIRLEQPLTTKLKHLSQARGATLNTVVLAAFQTLLFRYTEQQDFLIGSLTPGRTRAEFADIVGYFVNPVVLRALPDPEQSFVSFLQQTQVTLLRAIENQDYPFDMLVNQLHHERDFSRSPLFQVMFVFQRTPKFNDEGLTAFALDIAGAQMTLGSLQIESMALHRQVAQFDLTVTMGEVDGQLIASFEYNKDLFKSQTIERMAQQWQTLLAGIVANPEQGLAHLPLLTEQELEQFLHTWQGKVTEQPPDVTICSLFEAQAARTPEAVAVIFEHEQLTYSQLNKLAEQLASRIIDHGIGPEVCVGIYMDRSLNLLISILGVLKAGGAFSLLDPSYPAERLIYILRDLQAPVLLTTREKFIKVEQQISAEFAINKPTVISIEDESDLEETRLKRHITRHGNNLACVVYTSGSTGMPKGVLLENKAIANLIYSFIHSYHPTPDDRILPLTSLTSASFIGEILPLLCAGGALVLATPESFLDHTELQQIINKHGVSILSTVPTVIAALNDRKTALDSLRLLISGGEALDIEDIDTLLNSVNIVNSYGLTETAVCSTFYQVTSGAHIIGRGVPIGKPIINTAVYVLNSAHNFVPVGCPGEIYISGTGVARGYLNKPELTAEKFIENPYKPGEKMYRTGDLARWLPDGNLEFMERKDHQVKIRGHRIELGEIESALKQHDAVQDAVVVSHMDGSGAGNRQLIAYVVAGERQLILHELHHWLADKLPHYMLPTSLELLDELPVTPNGKIDIKDLPQPKGTQTASWQDYVAPKSQLERTIASIWQDVLKIEKVGLHHSFFELGGNSMLMAQAHHQIREELHLTALSLIDMFKHPTVSSLAKHISQKEDETDTLQDERESATKRKYILNERQKLLKERLKDIAR